MKQLKRLNACNTYKCTILRSMYSFYYLTPTCFDIVTILKELKPRFHSNIQQYTIYSKDAFVFM